MTKYRALPKHAVPTHEKKHSKGEGKTYFDFFSRPRRDHIEQHNAFAPTMHTQTMLHSTRQVIREFLKAPA